MSKRKNQPSRVSPKRTPLPKSWKRYLAVLAVVLIVEVFVPTKDSAFELKTWPYFYFWFPVASGFVLMIAVKLLAPILRKGGQP